MEIPDALTRIVQVLVDDEELRSWFESLKDFSVMERAVELRQTAGRISGKGRHFEIAHAVSLMAAPGMYEAVLDATHELLAAR